MTDKNKYLTLYCKQKRKQGASKLKEKENDRILVVSGTGGTECGTLTNDGSLTN